MQLQEKASVARNGVADSFRRFGEQKQVKGLLRFSRFERVLAAVCIGIPVLLIIVEGEALTSISAHYETAGGMSRENQWFYFPLTVAAMMFVFNGVVRRRHWYNVFLGLMLAGVILFNEDDFDLIHSIFAIAFFGGNFLVILFFSKGSPIPGVSSSLFKGFFLAAIAMAMLGHFVFDWYSLFFAEWLSFAAIAIHYILDSLEKVKYNAAVGDRQEAYETATTS